MMHQRVQMREEAGRMTTVKFSYFKLGACECGTRKGGHLSDIIETELQERVHISG